MKTITLLFGLVLSFSGCEMLSLSQSSEKIGIYVDIDLQRDSVRVNVNPVAYYYESEAVRKEKYLNQVIAVDRVSVGIEGLETKKELTKRVVYSRAINSNETIKTTEYIIGQPIFPNQPYYVEVVYKENVFKIKLNTPARTKIDTVYVKDRTVYWSNFLSSTSPKCSIQVEGLIEDTTIQNYFLMREKEEGDTTLVLHEKLSYKGDSSWATMNFISGAKYDITISTEEFIDLPDFENAYVNARWVQERKDTLYIE